MGLDGLEMIIALEEAFGVDLKAEDIAQAVTPRLMGDVIFMKLQATEQKVCQSLQGFNLLRKAFMRQFNLERSAVTLDMPFRNLIPQSEEKKIWADLKRSVNARSWPDLERPAWLVWMLVALVVGVFLIPFLVLWRLLPVGAEIAGIAGAAGMIGAIILAARWTRRFKTRIPARFRRIRDLVPFAVTSDQVPWTRDQVSALVKKVVLERLNITEVKYREDANFVKDFGMDS